MLDLATQIFEVAYQVVSVVTPTLNYLPQYLLMSKTRVVGTFDPRFCSLLLLSNLSRVVFWWADQAR